MYMYIDNLFYFIVSKGNTWEKQEKVREETLGWNGGESKTPHHPLAPTEGSQWLLP